MADPRSGVVYIGDAACADTYQEWCAVRLADRPPSHLMRWCSEHPGLALRPGVDPAVGASIAGEYLVLHFDAAPDDIASDPSELAAAEERYHVASHQVGAGPLAIALRMARFVEALAALVPVRFAVRRRTCALPAPSMRHLHSLGHAPEVLRQVAADLADRTSRVRQFVATEALVCLEAWIPGAAVLIGAG